MSLDSVDAIKRTLAVFPTFNASLNRILCIGSSRAVAFSKASPSSDVVVIEHDTAKVAALPNLPKSTKVLTGSWKTHLTKYVAEFKGRTVLWYFEAGQKDLKSILCSILNEFEGADGTNSLFIFENPEKNDTSNDPAALRSAFEECEWDMTTLFSTKDGTMCVLA